MIWIVLGVVFSEQNPYNQARSHTTIEFDDTGNEGCTAMNTYMLPDGKCACTEGFPHGDPASSRGCFRCTEVCSDSAICVYPGRCRCKSGFTGNGIVCEAPVPVLRFIEPDNFPINIKGRVNATIIMDAPIGISKGNCRFGTVITDGRMITNNIMECSLPPVHARTPNPVVFAVSFDNASWSKEYVMFSFQDPIQSNSWIRYVLVICGSVLIVIALYLIFKTEPIREDEDDTETTPFKQKNEP